MLEGTITIADQDGKVVYDFRLNVNTAALGDTIAGLLARSKDGSRLWVQGSRVAGTGPQFVKTRGA